MLLIITILITITTWKVQAQQFNAKRVCQGADHLSNPYDCADEDCDEEDAAETCQDLGDGINRCYWNDQNVVQICDGGCDEGGRNDLNRVCGYDGDAECLELDGTLVFLVDGAGGFGESVHYTSCLRCCPNAATGLNLCTETISTGQEQCGTVGDEILFVSSYEGGGFSNIAPCCSGEVCLDHTAGICGVAGEECATCTKWSYIQDHEQVYHQGDSCGDGLICLDDGSDPLIKNKPVLLNAELNDINFVEGQEKRRLFDGGDESIFNDLPVELQRRHEGIIRRLVDYTSLIDEIRYNRGICVPLDSAGECSNDDECAECMRCCDGQCKRIAVSTENEVCGFDEGRGPCCKGFECCNNECVTHAPTQTPTQSPTGGDEDDDDEDDDEDDDSNDDNTQIFGADSLVGVTDEKKNNDSKVVIQMSDKTLINLWGIIVISIIGLIICGYFCLYRKKTEEASFENDIDEINQNI